MSGSWFRLGVGRSEKADPKWLIPLICRLGGVQKRDIGNICIQQDDTLFQISDEKLARFNACRAGAEQDEVTIEPAEAPAGGAGPRRGRGGPPGGRRFGAPKGRFGGGPGGGRREGREGREGGRGPSSFKRRSGPARSGEKSTRRRS